MNDPAKNPNVPIIGKKSFSLGPVCLTFPPEWTPQGILEECRKQFAAQAAQAGKFDMVDKVHAFMAEPCAAAVFMTVADAMAERDEIIQRLLRQNTDLESRVKELEAGFGARGDVTLNDRVSRLERENSDG